MKMLSQIVLRSLEFFELTDESGVNSDAAVKQLEFIISAMSDATPEELTALSKTALDELVRLQAAPDKDGYTPRKTLTDEHKQFLESIVSGELFK